MYIYRLLGLISAIYVFADPRRTRNRSSNPFCIPQPVRVLGRDWCRHQTFSEIAISSFEIALSSLEIDEQVTPRSWVPVIMGRNVIIGRKMWPCYDPGYTFVEKLQTISKKFRKQQADGSDSAEFMRHYCDAYALSFAIDSDTAT
jgi:hypothetical protein